MVLSLQILCFPAIVDLQCLSAVKNDIHHWNSAGTSLEELVYQLVIALFNSRLALSQMAMIASDSECDGMSIK